MIFGWGDTILEICNTSSKLQLLFSDYICDSNRVLKLANLSFIGPVINLEVTQDGSVRINLKEFVNVFIEMNGWLFVSAIKVKAENWFSFQSMDINEQSFFEFVFNLLTGENVLGITQILKGLNIQWLFLFFIYKEAQGQFAAETRKSKNVLIEFQFSQCLIPFFVKISVIGKIFARFEIFMKNFSQFQNMVLLFDGFTTQSVNCLNLSYNQ